MRTEDTEYGEEYWGSLDGGNGYTDSTLWEDIAHIQKEVFGIRDGKDVAGEISYLDVGCARGYLVKHMRRRGFESWGTDFAAYILDTADPDAKSFLRCHDLTQQTPMQWNDGYFQLISCIETMEHIPEEHVGTALQHIRRVLDAPGHAVFTICTSEHPDPHDDPTHITIRGRPWWEVQLVDNGLVQVPELEARLRTFWLFSQHQGVFVCRRG